MISQVTNTLPRLGAIRSAQFHAYSKLLEPHDELLEVFHYLSILWLQSDAMRLANLRGMARILVPWAFKTQFTLIFGALTNLRCCPWSRCLINQHLAQIIAVFGRNSPAAQNLRIWQGSQRKSLPPDGRGEIRLPEGQGKRYPVTGHRGEPIFYPLRLE